MQYPEDIDNYFRQKPLKRRGGLLSIVLAIVAVVIILAQPIGVGIASSTDYTATTVNTGNSMATDYFTAGLYKYVGEDTIENVIAFNSSNFTPLTTVPFNQGELPYRSEGSTCSITNGSANCTIKDVFLAITNVNNHTSSDNTYSVSCEVNGLLEGMTCDANLICGDGSDTITANNAYRLFLNLRNVNYTGTASQPPPMILEVTITVADNNSAAFSSGGNTVTFRLSTTVDDFKEELEEANSELDGVEFYPDSDGNPPGVFIQNENSTNHSLAEKDSGTSTIDVTVTVPPGIYFCIFVHIDASILSGKTSNVLITVTKIKENGEQSYGTKEVASTSYFFVTPQVNKYVYRNGNSMTVSNDMPSNNNNNFFYCTTGERLEIEFSGEQDSSWLNTLTVTAKLVQKNDLY